MRQQIPTVRPNIAPRRSASSTNWTETAARAPVRRRCGDPTRGAWLAFAAGFSTTAPGRQSSGICPSSPTTYRPSPARTARPGARWCRSNGDDERPHQGPRGLPPRTVDDVVLAVRQLRQAGDRQLHRPVPRRVGVVDPEAVRRTPAPPRSPGGSSSSRHVTAGPAVADDVAHAEATADRGATAAMTPTRRERDARASGGRRPWRVVAPRSPAQAPAEGAPEQRARARAAAQPRARQWAGPDPPARRSSGPGRHSSSPSSSSASRAKALRVASSPCRADREEDPPPRSTTTRCRYAQLQHPRARRVGHSCGARCTRQRRRTPRRARPGPARPTPSRAARSAARGAPASGRRLRYARRRTATDAAGPRSGL